MELELRGSEDSLQARIRAALEALPPSVRGLP
jgi:hypothetical protein